jgi:membrane-bound lytic murein transglycosylase D
MQRVYMFKKVVFICFVLGVYFVDAQDTIPIVTRGSEEEKKELVTHSKSKVDIEKVIIDKETLVKYRFKKISKNVKFSYNKTVKSLISYFLKDDKFMERAIIRSSIYYPLFREIFKEEGVPEEMIHLSIIESCINPTAVSRVGATGIWQFMKYTGKMYGLKNSVYFDDRKDIIASTRAAAKFMKDLHERYNDWLLVVAGYNCGPGNVNKAIRRAGGKKNIWKIYKYLPRETRGYVPSFIAMNYIMSYKKELGLLEIEKDDLFFKISKNNIERISVRNKQLSLKKLASILDVDVKQIYLLNPSLQYKVIPKWNQTFTLTIPKSASERFYALKDTIWKSMDKIDIPNRLYHYVRKGECLSIIADKYNCRVYDLKAWNSLRSNTLRINQKLLIFTKGNQKSQVAKLKKSPAKTTRPTDRTQLTSKYMVYTIRKGDTLYDIAKKYPGVSAFNIMNYNKITHVKKVKPGMVIKIPKIKS